MTTETKTLSSQAGLSAYSGGQAKSLPSVPAPGQPGSRFNPNVVTREEQARRREASAAESGKPVARTKRLATDQIGFPPPNRAHQPNQPSQLEEVIDKLDGADKTEPDTITEVTKGFTKGVVKGHRSRVVMNPEHAARVKALDDKAAQNSESFQR